MAERVGWDADAYDEVASVQRKWGQAVLALRKWHGDETVLDVGCGTGALAADLLQSLPEGRVVALDSDPAMVAKARHHLARFGPRAKAIHADILAPPRDLGDFDVIFSNAVLHWISDHDRFFEILLHHLRPGGELLVQGGGQGNLSRARGAADELLRRPSFAPHFHRWSPPWRYEDDASTLERLFIAGFVDPEARLDPAPTPFPHDEAFEKFLRAVVLRPYLARLPDDATRERFVREYLELARGAGMGRSLDYVRLTIRARRAPHV